MLSGQLGERNVHGDLHVILCTKGSPQTTLPKEPIGFLLGVCGGALGINGVAENYTVIAQASECVQTVSFNRIRRRESCCCELSEQVRHMHRRHIFVYRCAQTQRKLY